MVWRTFAFLLLLIPAIARADEDISQVIAQLGLRESAVPAREMKGWQKPRKIVVLTDSPQRLAWFQEAVKGVTLAPAGGPAAAQRAVADADALVGFCSPPLVNAAPNLRWIQSQTAGVDECLAIPRVHTGEIILTNMQGVNAPNVAEHAMALVLTLTRQINAFAANQRDEKWNPASPQKPWDLQGKTMLVVGLGGNGVEIARRAQAFGMRVIATRNSGRTGPPFVAYVGTADELPKLIAQADILVNATPLTPETTGLFNAAMFARMKPTAYFFNVGRGPSVVTNDLVEALKSGRIGGAGLDVVDPEPLPNGHPLWQLPNVIITPHVAGNSDLKFERSWLVMRENMRRYVAGEKLLSLVDAKRGY